uniref:Uncharacterized protein n=1 Tax=Tetranychus urticae TaxID=32264 RepID=T1KPJ2_TETUR
MMSKNVFHEERELINDPKYRSFAQNIDKALKAFEGTSRWPDLVYALSRLIKVLENNVKFGFIPARLLVGQRLAQCMHPELPSGVHLKALETYDLIFKIIGPDRLVQELSIYSNGLFPLLSQASINVKPELIKIYENHFVTLGDKLKPALDGFLIASLPGLEEGSDHYTTTDNLLKKVCEGVGKHFFYGALWRVILIDSSVRLPAISFITSHFVKKKSLEEQLYIKGTSLTTFLHGLCASLLDQNVLVQRAVLDLLLDCFPMHNQQISNSDMISITTAAITVLLRRDISLNRRLDSWLFGADSSGQSYLANANAMKALNEKLTSSGGTIISSNSGSRSRRRREAYFMVYSKEFVYKALVLCLGDIKMEKCSSDMVRTCNLLLSNLKLDYLWQRLYDLLEKACNLVESGSVIRDGLSATDYPQPVGTSNIKIIEILSLMDFMVDATSNDPETASKCYQDALLFILDRSIKCCYLFKPGEMDMAINLCSKLATKIQPTPQVERSKTPAKERDSLADIKEETESLCASEVTLKMDDIGLSSTPATTPSSAEPSLLGSTLALSPAAIESDDNRSYTDKLIAKVANFFDVFVRTRLIENESILQTCFEQFLLSNPDRFDGVNSSNGVSSTPSPPSNLILNLNASMIPVYINLCQLLVKAALIQKVGDELLLNGLMNGFDLRDDDYKKGNFLSEWTKELLVLSIFTRKSNVKVKYTSISTFLDLVSILKSQLMDIPLPPNLANFTPSSSPVLDFNNSETLNRVICSGLCIEKFLSGDQLNFIYNSTDYFIKVTQELWDNLSDEFSELHLETAILLQQVHNLAADSSVCESVICFAMASSDEIVSYEARRKFCTLFSITRDLRQKSSLYASMREFDRPLFFMLDSLTHKLDAHNAQAFDWLNQCLKYGDVARILEPLMFILLHPDTNRVSVQHVNIHQPSDPSGTTEQNVTGRSDEADNAAIAAAEAKIYAISSTGGNLIYHVNPEGKKRFTSAASTSSNKVLALTSQNTSQTSSSKSSQVTGKWVTQKCNLPDYEVPFSCDQSNNSGKHLSINMFLNPFGSLSSLTSEVLESIDNNPVSLISVVPTSEWTLIKSNEDIRRTPTPTPTPISTPIPSRASKISMEEPSETSSDSEIIANLMDELIDNVVSRVEDGDDESQSSSSETTTRQTISESVSLTSWLKPISVNHLHSHILLYTQVYDSRRTLYALTTLWNIILAEPQMVLFKMATTSISNRLGTRSHELQLLCARHRKSILGRSFYGDVDTESVTAFRSSSFLEVIVTTCLYYIRSFYPCLPQSRLNEDEIQGNQKVRILSCEILRLIFSELVTAIKRIPNLSSYLNDMLMRCKSQKVILHGVVSSVYNFQQKSELKGNSGQKSGKDRADEDTFPDTIVEFNEKMGSSGFQEDMQKSILKLLEQLIILEHKVSPVTSQAEKDLPTHNRKESDSRAARIRFQPQMSALKYCPNILIPSQSMFLSAIQTALQQTHKANLHSNWLSLVEATLPFAGRSLTRLVVCVISQLCHNLESIAQKIENFSDPTATITSIIPPTGTTNSSSSSTSNEDNMIPMPPNYLTIILKSLSTLCHYCLLDTSNTVSNTMTTLPQPSNISPNPTSTTATTSTGPLQVLSSFLNVFTGVEGISDLNQNRENSSNSSGDPLLSSRRTVLSHLPRILGGILAIWRVITKAEESDKDYDSGNGRGEGTGWQIMGTPKDVKKNILSFLSPISLLHGNNFMSSVATVWYDLRDTKNISDKKSVIPPCSAKQTLLVDLIAAVRVLPMESVLQTVRHVIKQPPHSVQSRKKRIPLEVSMLQFLLAYIKVFPGSQLLECWKSLLALLRDGLQISASSPLAQFHLLAILHEFVQAAPLFEDRKDQKDLQEVAQKLVEACTNVAAARLSQTKWLRKNLEVRPGPQQDDVDEENDYTDYREPSSLKVDASPNSLTLDSSINPDSDTFLARYSVQALNALAQFVAPVLDVVYVSEEKEKVVPLVSNIIGYVTPYLRNHSKNNIPSFRACSHLLSSISGYQYSRKAWRKDALELLLDPAFFQIEPYCLKYWKTIVDHLMTHDKTSFRDFLIRMSVNQSGSLKIFSSKDQETELRAQLAKRLAFILFCSEKDQYQRYMPEIQEKLIEALRVNSSSILQANILICFRILISRMSSHYLTSLWPFIYTEMCQVFLQIEAELMPEGNELR